jgi:hypothetical protein
VKKRLWGIALLLASAALEAQISTSILRPVGYHPSNIAYFNTPYFANALFAGGEWYSFTSSEFGSPIDYNTAQFINGYPQFLQPGQKLRGFLFGLNINYGNRPAAWPARDTLAKGRIVVTWKGNADIRLVSGTFVPGDSSGAATGSLVDGRRGYLCTSPSESTQSIEVHAIVTPLTEIRVWLAPPDDPATPAHENQTGSLEGQLFHPLLLQRIADADWGFIRFMDWGMTNGSPQQEWSDRRLPVHIFQTGIINAREPATGAGGNRPTGVAFEYMVALCNATGRNMWINVPHLASDDFMTRLAKLIRFGSDGVNPYDTPQVSPVFEPLRSDLKVYIEYSNEMWSSGFAFAQGDFAQQRATALGITKPQFNARRFCDTWRIFQSVFGDTSRLVRVAAIFTALDSYSRAFLTEMGTYGPTLSPQVRPDVMAVTTYFGNGIQDFVNGQGFTTGKSAVDPYWTSPLFQTHLQIAFDEWRRRILAGDATAGSGPDATGIGGGFASSLRTLPNETLGFSLPIIAYEGGPSLFTDNIDGGGLDDDGVTTFIEAMNRDPRIADVYRIHLEIAKSKGLWTHTPYTDTINWGKFGQWGHLETLDQPPASQPKYALMLEHFALYTTLHHIDQPAGNVPQFSTSANLAPGVVGLFYASTISTSGGDGARAVTVIGTSMDSGLSVAAGNSPGTLRVSGTPTSSRKNFILARVTDADGDPAWRIFTIDTFGGSGTLVQSDFRGTSPALARPWTQTFVLSPKVTWSGWNIGAGVVAQAGDNAFTFSVSGTAGTDETLTQAMADNEFLTATVTPATGPLDLRGGEVRFSSRRIGFHSPTGYAFFCSITGFTQPSALYVSTATDKGNFSEIEHVVTLPATAAFSAVNSPLEFRIYAFGAQFDGHNTSLTAFKLTEVPSGPTPAAPGGFSANAQSTTQIALTWSAVSGATYEVTRRFNDGIEQIIATPGTPGFTDGGLSPSTAYLYRVRAVTAGGTSAFTNSDLATTIMFSNDPILFGQTTIRGDHLVEMRDATNAVRVTAGLPLQTWTDDPIIANTTVIRAVHITQMRTALLAALTALGLPLPSFTQGISAGTVVRAPDIQELRNVVK